MTIKHRSELLFIYDISNGNPNGDPANENKPRTDPDTDLNIVTDVRLKRTIRDYFYRFRGKEIFVRRKEIESKGIQDAISRAADFSKDKTRILNECIDIRLFGGTIPLESKKAKEKPTDEGEDSGEKSPPSLMITGPVQFKMGRSLHKIELQYIKGTGAFASKAGKEQKTFREEWTVPYSLIAFYGIVNENAAQDTGLSEDDVDLLLEGIWHGTKNLISRTKIGQNPRLLLRIEYQTPNYHLGDLDRLIHLRSQIEEQKIRDISEFVIDITELISSLGQIKEKIVAVHYFVDGRTLLQLNDQPTNIKTALSAIGIQNKELPLG